MIPACVFFLKLFVCVLQSDFVNMPIGSRINHNAVTKTSSVGPSSKVILASSSFKKLPHRPPSVPLDNGAFAAALTPIIVAGMLVGALGGA